MRFLNFLAVCGTFAMCVSLVLVGEFLTLSQTMEQAILNGGPLEYECSRVGPRCKRWKGTSAPDIERLGTITVPAKTKKLIHCKYYAGVHYENHKNHEVKVSAKQVADEVRGLVDLCPTDCAENKKLQAVGKFEDHTLYMLHEGCS